MARHVRPAKRESTERSKNRVSKNSSKKRRKPKIADDLTLLPHCKGPKLGPFSSRPPRIDFIDYLSDPETAAHAHVFEVEIGGVRYALKIFKFYSDDIDWEAKLWAEAHKSKFPKDQGLPQNHIDPFFAECRAYGAIIDHGLNGVISPKCYGYLMLTRSQEEQIERAFSLCDEDWYRLTPLEEGRPLRAIVKELMAPGPTFLPEHIPNMYRALKTLNRIGVYPDDIAARNYRNGQLFDFSAAMTIPHVQLSYGIFDKKEVQWQMRSDLAEFDQMIEEEGIDTPIRAYGNPEYCRKLRSHGPPHEETQHQVPLIPDYHFPPREEDADLMAATRQDVAAPSKNSAPSTWAFYGERLKWP